MQINIIRQSIWAFLGKFLTATSSILTGMVLARILSPEDLGAYFMAFSIVTSISLIAVFGLNTSVVKFIASGLGTEQPGRIRDAVKGSFGLALIFALSVCSVFYFGVGEWLVSDLLGFPSLRALVGLIAAWIFLLVFEILAAESFRGFHRIGRASLIASANSVGVIAVILAFSLIVPAVSLQDVFFISVGTLAIVVIISLGALFKRVKDLGHGQGSLGTGELLRTALPNGVTNAIYFMLSQFDLWIIGAFKTGADVAVYGAAAKLVKMVSMPLMIVSLVAPPLVARMHASGQIDGLQKVLRSFATLAGWPAIFVLVLFVFGGRQVLGLVYGEFYGAGAMILAVLSVGQLVNVWSGSCGIVLAMTGNHRVLMFISILCGALVFTLGVLLVEDYGMLAVAAVSSGGMILQNALMLLAARRSAGVWSHMQFFINPKRAFDTLRLAGGEPGVPGQP